MAIFLEDEVFLGTERKYLIEIQSSGFDMDADDFDIEIKRGPNVIRYSKADLIKDIEGNYYITVDTAELGAGAATMTVVAHVPDQDFDDGIRDEVDKFKFLRIKSH